MNSKSDENQRLKSNLIVRIAILVALPVAALSLQTIRVGMLSGTIRDATSVETLARSARDNYKSFVDRVVDAVDTGTVSTSGLQYLGEAGKSLRQLHSLRDDGDLAALDANLQEQLDKLIADPSLNGLMQIRPKINTASSALDTVTHRLESGAQTTIDELVKTSEVLFWVFGSVVAVILVLTALLIMRLARGINAMITSLESYNVNLLAELDERKRVERRLDQLAHFDPVTLLSNRNMFQKKLDLAVELSRQANTTVAVLFVDLDNFKLVNDSYGHHIGDKLLQTAGERLTQSVRAGDMVCRLGGDEFAIILEHVSGGAVVGKIAEKLISNLTKPLRLDGHEVVVSGSIGAALYPDDADSAEALVRFADSAMYAAKGDGKNTWRRFDPVMATQTTRRLTLENQMRRGLEAGHFEVHYQPQVDTASGTADSFEALARWNDPEQGYISPAQFIPVAEESGLIRPLGEWVLRTACRQIMEWSKAAGRPLKVAVNVSARQLVHADFPDCVKAILAETGCPPAQIELEITESLLMQNFDKTRPMLQVLHDYGICIAIDDFGTGYSSMSQLKNMPITKLKIDKRFVDNIETDRDDLTIASAMAGLAHNLDIRVIAEGVENEGQVTLLRQSHCDVFQGYYFSRPLHPDAVPEFLARKVNTPLLASEVRLPAVNKDTNIDIAERDLSPVPG